MSSAEGPLARCVGFGDCVSPRADVCLGGVSTLCISHNKSMNQTVDLHAVLQNHMRLNACVFCSLAASAGIAKHGEICRISTLTAVIGRLARMNQTHTVVRPSGAGMYPCNMGRCASLLYYTAT
jgi:hypothetical protein